MELQLQNKFWKHIINYLLVYNIMSYYAVAKGFDCGIYDSWKECQEQINGFKCAKFKKFSDKQAAEQFINENDCQQKEVSSIRIESDYYVYTDGACSNNGNEKAIAGIGIYFGNNDPRNVSKQILGKSTNNVAELCAIIEACQIIEDDLENRKTITIVSDSNYSILCASSYGEKNALQKWKKDIPNKDLVKTLFEFASRYSNLQFEYVQAHTNKDDIHSIGNHHADLLATSCLHN